jgi:hypothetical protein
MVGRTAEAESPNYKMMALNKIMATNPNFITIKTSWNTND